MSLARSHIIIRLLCIFLWQRSNKLVYIWVVKEIVMSSALMINPKTVAIWLGMSKGFSGCCWRYELSICAPKMRIEGFISLVNRRGVDESPLGKHIYSGRAYSSKWNKNIYDVPVLQELNDKHLLDQLSPYNNHELLNSIWTAEYPS